MDSVIGSTNPLILKMNHSSVYTVEMKRVNQRCNNSFYLCYLVFLRSGARFIVRKRAVVWEEDYVFGTGRLVNIPSKGLTRYVTPGRYVIHRMGMNIRKVGSKIGSKV